MACSQMCNIMNNSMVEVTENEYETVKAHFTRFPERYSRHTTGRDEIWFDKSNSQVVGAVANYHSKFFAVDDLYTALVSLNTGE